MCLSMRLIRRSMRPPVLYTLQSALLAPQSFQVRAIIDCICFPSFCCVLLLSASTRLGWRATWRHARRTLATSHWCCRSTTCRSALSAPSTTTTCAICVFASILALQLHLMYPRDPTACVVACMPPAVLLCFALWCAASSHDPETCVVPPHAQVPQQVKTQQSCDAT
jgi:hypothetical protein